MYFLFVKQLSRYSYVSGTLLVPEHFVDGDISIAGEDKLTPIQLSFAAKATIQYPKFTLMQLKPVFIFTLLSLLCTRSITQPFPPTKYPVNFFRSPLGIPIQLAGNFGELRNNHFHMGLDMRTNQRENLPVYAAAEGYVSRIKIEKFGFGRAIYITHPNGYTTLYAHLNDFYPELNEHVKTIQYRTEQWEQDLILPPGMFTVNKGRFIAYSGNTGGSGGPHLHFEIRETYTENNLNPFPFNFGIADKIPPFIYSLFLYDRRYSTYQKPPTKIPIKGAGSAYASTANVVITGSPVISFGISAEDKTNSSFKFGIYQAELWLDDVLQSAFRMDNFLYDESRYINASTDFNTRAKGGPWIQHLSKLPGNRTPIFSAEASNGVIELKDSEIHIVLINVKDAAGNTTTLRFKIRYDPAKTTNLCSITNTIPMLPNQPNTLRLNNVEADFSEKAFYDTVAFSPMSQPSANPLFVSEVHSLHNYTVPVHDSFTVRIRATKPMPPELKDKVVMQLVSNRKKVALKGNWQNDWMEAKFRDLGTVQLRIDTVAPRLIPSGWVNGANVRGRSSITIIADDDISDLKSFRAELDGKWLMFSRKSDYFICKFDEHTPPGPHQLKVWATDEAGNMTEKTFFFTR